MATQKLLGLATFVMGVSALGSCTVAAPNAAPLSTSVELSGPQALSATATAAMSVNDAMKFRLQSLIQLDGHAGSTGALGSGCAIEEEAEIPDGTWFVFVREVDSESGSGAVDVACMFGQDSDQWEIYEESFADDEHVEHFVISNDVVNPVTVHVDPGAVFYLSSHDWVPVEFETAAVESNVLDGRRGAGLWIVVDGGKVVGVVEPRWEPEA
ncbi:hypothetical protein [Demequina sediminicola]|uniref:hypothetical protein n=1 Tax=Demequina sediminicola TaxID=1095026 RepID=UPI000780FCF0|nr:hypothetical protein [Demequina sediminicola]